MTTTIGTCTLDRDIESATMTGPTGKHTIERCGDDPKVWEARVEAHWNGFLSNNGVKATKPAKTTVNGSAPDKNYTVTIRFQFPAWDEVDGIPYTNIEAPSKSEAIKQVRRTAWDDGHTAMAKGKGRITFTATETE
jgi:hypothetical protein